MAEPRFSLEGAFEPVSRQTWHAQVERELKGADFERRLVTRTHEGIDLQPIYDDSHGLTAPAAARVTRGWSTRQTYSLVDAEAAARDIAADLAQGADGVWLRFDGARPRNLDVILQAVDFARHAIHLEGEPDAATYLFAIALERGVDLDALRGGEGLDPLTAPEARFSAHWRPWRVSTVADHEAGASVVHTVAYTLATGAAALRRLVDERGLSIDEAASAIEFEVACGRDFFTSVAGLRALRVAWARLVEACGGSVAARRMWIHARTSARTQTRRDPWVNLLRGSAETFAAAIGGADSISTDPFDAAIGAPDPASRRRALHTQTVLRAEAHLGHVADPAGGSWLVEKLTDDIARAAWTAFQSIEHDGGMAAARAAGRIDAENAETAKRRARAVARRRDAIVGVSMWPDLAEAALERPPGPPRPVRRDAAPFEALRDAADAAAVRPSVFLANLGPIPAHKARADFATQLLNAGGVAVIGNDGFDDDTALVGAFVEAGAKAAIICGSDVDYAARATDVSRALKAAGARAVWLAGRPGNHESTWRDAGVDDFVFLGGDAIAALTSLLNGLEVLS